MPMKVKRLFAFDFDDTLAITSSIIGVQRVQEDGNIDPTFIDWILDNSLNYESIENRGQNNEVVWFSSEGFAHYEEKARQDLDYINSNGFEDKYDFSKTASVDLDSTSPISGILSLAKEAQSDPDTLVVIITARSGVGSLPSLTGSPVKPTNQKDILDFLSSQGLDVSGNHINTAGDLGGNSGAKASIMKSYIDQYEPEIVYFYDDNSGNVQAVAALCQDYYPHVKIKTFKVGEGGSVSSPTGCYENFYRL